MTKKKKKKSAGNNPQIPGSHGSGKNPGSEKPDGMPAQAKGKKLPAAGERIKIMIYGAVAGVLTVLFLIELIRSLVISLAGFETGFYFQAGFFPRYYPLFTPQTSMTGLLFLLAAPQLISMFIIELSDIFLRRLDNFAARIFVFSFEFINVSYFLFSGFFLLFRVAVKKGLPPDWNYFFSLYPSKSLEENLLRVLAGAVVVFLYSGFSLSRTKNSLTKGEEQFSLPSGKAKTH